MANGAARGDEGSRHREVLDQLPNLQRRARALLACHADAADLVQDTVERALRALPRLRPGSDVAAWLNTLLNNRFIDGWRRADHRRLFPLDERTVAAPEPDEEPPPPRWLDISMGEIDAAIDRLPRDAAVILRLQLSTRLSYSQISRRLGIASGTVGSRLLRARWRLRDILTARVSIAPDAATAPRARRRPAPASRRHGPTASRAARARDR